MTTQPIQGDTRSLFSIEEVPNRYRLHHVPCHDGLYTIDWSTTLLDNGRYHTPQEWLSLTRDGEWKVPSAPLVYASLAALYQNRNHADARQRSLVEKVRGMFHDDFAPSKPYMMTSTRVIYPSRGMDRAVHNYGYPDQREIQAGLVGYDGYINSQCHFDDAIEALLGSRDMVKVELAGEWVTGRKPYLYRVNSKSKRTNDTERVVILGCNVDDFNVVAYCSLDGDWSARGVVERRSP